MFPVKRPTVTQVDGGLRVTFPDGSVKAFGTFSEALNGVRSWRDANVAPTPNDAWDWVMIFAMGAFLAASAYLARSCFLTMTRGAL